MKRVCLARLLGVISLWVVLSTSLLAARDAIVLKEFAVYPSDEPQVLVANLRFDYELSSYLRESLLNGVTLRNEVRFDLVWYSEWWFDRRERLTSIVTELKYHALSGQYQLIQENSGENWNFSSLSAALDHLGDIGRFQLPPLPNKAYANEAALFTEAILEPESPDSPLNLSYLFSDKHRLVSQGVLWTIQP